MYSSLAYINYLIIIFKLPNELVSHYQQSMALPLIFFTLPLIVYRTRFSMILNRVIILRKRILQCLCQPSEHIFCSTEVIYYINIFVSIFHYI